jgi:hypothetical protein
LSYSSLGLATELASFAKSMQHNDRQGPTASALVTRGGGVDQHLTKQPHAVD